MSDSVIDIIAEMYPDTLKADGYDDCILGVADRDGETVIVYSSSKIIEKLMSNDGMDSVEAQEWFEYNISGAYMGPKTPIYVEDSICELR